VHEQIQAEFGVQSSVNARSHKGAKTVTVYLHTVPTGSSDVVKRRVEALCRAQFPDATNIVVAGKL